MSAKPDAEAAPAKSKKLLVIVAVLVVVLAGAAGGAWVFISKQRAAAAEADGDAPPAKAAGKPAAPPVFLPLDNMVVNLADAGGEKVAQVGVTLEVVDAHASDSVKAYLPAIRSGILLLISQRTAAELLSREGKDKLAHDILVEAAKPFGGLDEEEEEEKPAPKGKKKKPAKKVQHELPVKSVLFSSFIVQ